jgi:protein-S-isoprenylcysteine O-methyltransferase Ste14
MTDPLAFLAALCWVTVVSVWIVGAAYSAAHDRRPRTPLRTRLRDRDRPPGIVRVAFVACAVVVVAGQLFAQELIVNIAWIRAFGLALLAASTAFTLWARFALGASWSVAPRVGEDRRLRTTGPYGITRHPIYTGILGMLLGSAMVGGIGVWIAIVAVALIAFEVKIRMEEELLVASFPDEYPDYRRRVPQLVPGLNLLRRHRPAQA